LEALLQDLRLSWRVLAKNPGVTAVAVLCMALGIGANTTVYSIVEAALFRPFPFADPDRIVALHRSRTQEPRAPTSPTCSWRAPPTAAARWPCGWPTAPDAGGSSRQLLTESVLLALAGAALGCVLAAWSIRLLEATAFTDHPLPYWVRFDLDAPVLLCTLLAAVGTGLLFGLAPAASATRRDLHQALKEGARAAGAGPGRQRLRAVLVVTEVGLVLVLLVGAALFTRAFLELRAETGGFDGRQLLTLRTFLPDAAYPTEAARRRPAPRVRGRRRRETPAPPVAYT